MNKTKNRWSKFVIIVAAAGLLTIATSSEPSVKAEASSSQGKFTMSYLFFGNSNSYTSQVDKSGQTLDVVSPSYFHINVDGSLQLSDSLQDSFITDMHQRGKRVVPFFSNDFDRTLGEKAIDNREALVNQIVEAIEDHKLDGINMDIENVDAAFRDKYTDMVKMLRDKLPSGMEVSVAVAANPTGATNSWIALYDYKALAAVSDYLMIMAYDESYPGDPTPGPVASLPFVEKSIRYAVAQAPADKIVLGVPFYGRYWNQNAAANGSGVSAQTLMKLIDTYKGTVRYDAASQSPVATFTISPTDAASSVYGNKLGPGDYTVWFENEQSLKEKLKLVGKYNLKGTGSWSLNQETTDTWDYYSLWSDGFYFADMQKHWALADVLTAANRGWMLGIASDRFAPDAALTRAEAATIIVRVLGLKGEASSVLSASFSDVPATHWAWQDIRLAKQSGLIQGISSDRFAPDQIMTREQMSVLLSRALQLTSQAGGGAAAKGFTDVPAGSWSAGAIAAMSSNGLVDGFADGTFRPRASLTRGEMAALLSRAQPLLTK
ncbi:spore germination protein YaaH [Paenibacillus sp. V4I3]|uniref:S-layer homology domain-containing protein n=1 Tax=unclassified Paenibacillus TaxID=185978 RepID=UPI00277E7C35|nr:MULTISPECIES: S-layer homology domain-containing protein [unclassified Paenibacillus]MDQ0871791.1 spore germination protein YaaH [Paenibacillus sp. V4I3]MDQ0892325.1 spore germination protein YaaH [Paenibacillus sp. V4I9]